MKKASRTLLLVGRVFSIIFVFIYAFEGFDYLMNFLGVDIFDEMQELKEMIDINEYNLEDLFGDFFIYTTLLYMVGCFFCSLMSIGSCVMHFITLKNQNKTNYILTLVFSVLSGGFAPSIIGCILGLVSLSIPENKEPSNEEVVFKEDYQNEEAKEEEKIEYNKEDEIFY